MVYRKLLPLVIILFWIATTSSLIYRHAPIKGSGIEAQSLLPEKTERWMGIYLKGQKIGFSSSRFYREAEGYSVYEEIKMRLTVFGTEQDTHTLTHVFLSPDLRIQSFRFSMESVEQRLKISGKFTGKTLNLDIETPNSKRAHKIELAEEPQMSPTVLPYLIKKGLKNGTRLRLPVFDPLTMSIQNMLIEIAGMEKIMIAGREVEAFKLRGHFQGVELLMWVDEEGNKLKEESPLLGFTLISEPREEAMKVKDAPPDIIQQTSVTFNLRLPHEVSYLRMRLKGIDLKAFELHGGRQTLRGNIVEIVKEDLLSLKPLELPISGMEPFLEDTPFVPSKDPMIINLAREIIGKEKNSLTVARLLHDWVFKNIEKTPSITIPTALDVLKTRRGDCNEHTTLYAALARSIGLPVRITVGLVYKDGSFYYHAWPEVFVGKWIAIDPTLGQFPADAKYLRLLSGDLDKQLGIVRVINKLSLEGIEYR